MRIIPAIDLIGGVVVHGIAGRRNEYRPLKSCLAANAQPASIARGLIDTLGLTEFYVADLDAIAGAEPDWATYKLLIQEGASLWIDAGISNIVRGEALSRFADAHPTVTGIIVGSESLADAEHLPKLVSFVGADRLIFSLDLLDGVVRTAATTWNNRDYSARTPADSTHHAPRDVSPHAEREEYCLLSAVIAAGIRRLIVLDVAAVGTGQGCPTLDLCREIRSRYPEIELASGGGIRGMADVEKFAATGCDAALVATALHEIGSPDF